MDPHPINKAVVAPGLDPGAYTMSRQRTPLRLRSLNSLMDCRVKPGNDTAVVATFRVTSTSMQA
jgi:hypothetical protein